MKIVVLGWGSLIWDPRNLLVVGEWFRDGPYIPIEFARISKDGRLTLVLFPRARKSQVLWAYMDTEDLNYAIENLRIRERTISQKIGFIDMKLGTYRCKVIPELIDRVKKWACKKKINAVIWTDLNSNFEKMKRTNFTPENIIKHLEKLSPFQKNKAEIYIRRTPLQIRTNIREIIEDILGWTPVRGKK